MLKTLAPDADLLGWVLDERKAYRQMAVRPDQRKFSVICLQSPHSGKPSFFIMVGHSFGLVSAVYNYNRRSAAINEILVSLFNLVAFSFYDDKYGFEPSASAASAREVAELVHWWLGARFDQKKLQLSAEPTILGVTYNLKLMQSEIKEERRRDLLEEIDAILQSELLDPGVSRQAQRQAHVWSFPTLGQDWPCVLTAHCSIGSSLQHLSSNSTCSLSNHCASGESSSMLANRDLVTWLRKGWQMW